MKWWISIMFYLCFLCANVFATGGGTEEGEFGGIKITEKQAALVNGIVNFLFSYEENPENAEVDKLKKAKKNVPISVIPAKSEKILKVGIVRDNLPFTAIRNDVPVGFEVDLVYLLSEEEGIGVEILPMNMTEIEENIKKDAVDVILGSVIKNKQNDTLWDYSDGYLNADIVAVYLKKFKKNLQKFSFEGKCIAVIKGSFFERYIQQANIQNVEVVSFETNSKMLEALLRSEEISAKSIDFLLTNSHTACDWKAKHLELEWVPLETESEIAIQMKKNSPWLSTINKGVKNLVGSQKFLELLRRWSIKKI